jgi:DNA-binding GntR family transcriptional regulator
LSSTPEVALDPSRPAAAGAALDLSPRDVGRPAPGGAALDLSPRDVGTLVDEIVDQLRGQIVRGELPPGSKIRQQHCADMLGVSRTPLREALHRLEADGWVRLRARHGAEVRRLSVAEAEEIFTLRVILETFAARLNAIAHSSDREPLAAELSGRAADEAGALSAARAEDANLQFHQLIYGLTDGTAPPELAAAVRRHWARALRYQQVYWSRPESARHSRSFHELIYEAWRARDADATERAVAAHILSAMFDIARRIDPESEPTLPIQQLAIRYGVELG